MECKGCGNTAIREGQKCQYCGAIAEFGKTPLIVNNYGVLNVGNTTPNRPALLVSQLRAMSSKELRNALADAYPEYSDRLRACRGAGLNHARIQLSGSAINAWMFILDEARNQNMMEELLRFIESDTA